MNQIQTFERQLLEEIKAKFPGVTPTISYLRQEVVLENNKSTYTFDFNDSNQAKATERRLNRQDVFYAVKAGLYLMQEKEGEEGSGVLQTYPNPEALKLTDDGGAPAVTTFDPAHLETIYNGFMAVQINDKVVYEALDTARFRQVPDAQQSDITSYSAMSYESGLVKLDPYFVLSGDRKNKLTVNIPSFAGIKIASATNGVQNKLVMRLAGIIVPGGVEA